MKNFFLAVILSLTAVVGIQMISPTTALAKDYWAYSKSYDGQTTTEAYVISDQTYVDDIDGYLMTDVKIVNRGIVRQTTHYLFQKNNGQVTYMTTGRGQKRWYPVRGDELWAIYNKASELVGGY